MNVNTQEYNPTNRERLIDELGEDSEDFKGLQKLFDDGNGYISWEELLVYSVIEGGKLQEIQWGKNLDLIRTNIKNLWKITVILGNIIYENPEFLNLGRLNRVNGSIILKGAHIDTQIELNKKIGTGNIVCLSIYPVIFGGEVENIKKLLDQKHIYGILFMNGTKQKNLAGLEELDGDLFIENSDIETLSKLKNANDIFANEAKFLKDLGKLKKVGNIQLRNCSSLSEINKLSQFDSMDLYGTPCNIQKVINNKIGNLFAIRHGSVTFGGTDLGIIPLFIDETIKGDLDLSNADFELPDNISLKIWTELILTGANYNLQSAFNSAIGEKKVEAHKVTFGGGGENIGNILQEKVIRGRFNIENVSFFNRLILLSHISKGNITIKGEIYGDTHFILNHLNFYLDFLKKIQLHCFSVTKTLQDELSGILEKIGLPEERDNEMTKVMNHIGKEVIENYIKSVDKEMRKADFSQEEEKNKFIDDREEKNHIFRKIFGNKLVDQI